MLQQTCGAAAGVLQQLVSHSANATGTQARKGGHLGLCKLHQLMRIFCISVVAENKLLSKRLSSK